MFNGYTVEMTSNLEILFYFFCCSLFFVLYGALKKKKNFSKKSNCVRRINRTNGGEDMEWNDHKNLLLPHKNTNQNYKFLNIVTNVHFPFSIFHFHFLLGLSITNKQV